MDVHSFSEISMIYCTKPFFIVKIQEFPHRVYTQSGLRMFSRVSRTIQEMFVHRFYQDFPHKNWEFCSSQCRNLFHIFQSFRGEFFKCFATYFREYRLRYRGLALQKWLLFSRKNSSRLTKIYAWFWILSSHIIHEIACDIWLGASLIQKNWT